MVGLIYESFPYVWTPNTSSMEWQMNFIISNDKWTNVKPDEQINVIVRLD